MNTLRGGTLLLALVKLMSYYLEKGKHHFKFGDRIIEMSKEYKYLGTVFSTDKNMLKKKKN